ncbi:MAG: cytochrome c biogenesis protein CcdA [Chloroflexi bacterium]|nr:cytochrome c biogenesis protein CcdA [Chloroflexota bacterium]
MIEAFFADLARWLPFGYAFGAGMLTSVSPCGVAMLPAYASLHLGTEGGGFWTRTPLRRSARALLASAAVTLGFVALFGVAGAVISSGGQLLVAFIPWIAVIIGALLIVTGVYLVAGGRLYTSLPARLASRLGGNGTPGIRGFFIFGIAYGIAALSCTLPVFLAVVGSALAMGGFAPGLFQFISYALGMGLVVAVVAIASALFREAVHRWLRRLMPAMARLSGLLLIFAGGYILYYWFTMGDILRWML